MPKYEYKETYNMGTPISDAISNIVFVPVKGIKNDSGKLVNGLPKLFQTYTELRKYNNPTATAITLGDDFAYVSTSKSYALARALLERGMYVLIQGITTTDITKSVYLPEFETGKYYTKSTGAPYTPEYEANTYYVKVDDQYILLESETAPEDWGTGEYYEFDGEETYTPISFVVTDTYTLIASEPSDWGTNEVYTKNDTTEPATYDQVTFTETQVVIGEKVTSADLDFEILKDRNLYNPRFISFGDFQVDNNVIENAIDCAYERKDTVVLIDHPEDVNSLSKASKYTGVVTDYVAKVRTYFEQFIDNDDAVKTSYASGTSPWVNVTINTIEIDTKGNKVTVSKGIDLGASYGYLFAFANGVKDKNNANWFPMAGSFRGVIPGINGVAYEYNSAEIEVLQGRSDTKEVKLDDEFDNVGIGINPIALINPYGYIVWGNRTMYVNNDTEPNRPNYRAFLNIRNLVISIAKQCYIARNKYAFEPNTDILWTNFKAMITPLLDKMQSGLGINGYKIVKVKTNAKARICARIEISPIEGVEDFSIEVQLNDSITVVE